MKVIDEGGAEVLNWIKVSGPTTLTFSPGNALTTSISGWAQGTYQIKASATDTGGLTGTATRNIIVNPASNMPPVVNAGIDQTVTAPVSIVTLSGTASDPDGTVSSVSWSQISGPVGGSSIVSPNSLTTLVSSLVPGTYSFKLTATDNVGAISSDTVNITVLPALPNGQTNFARWKYLGAYVRKNLVYEYTYEISGAQDSTYWEGHDNLGNALTAFIDRSGPHSLYSSDSAKRSGNRALRAEITKDDNQTASSYRSEYMVNSAMLKGTPLWPDSAHYEGWFGASIMPGAVDSIIDPEPTSIWQAHNVTDSGENGNSPSAWLQNKGGYYVFDRAADSNRITCGAGIPGGCRYSYQHSDTLGKVVPGQWEDWVFHIKFADSAHFHSGILQIWKNGVLMVNYTGPIGYNDSNPPFIKYGIYHWSWGFTPNTWATTGPHAASDIVYYYDEIRVATAGANYSDVAPNKN